MLHLPAESILTHKNIAYVAHCHLKSSKLSLMFSISLILINPVFGAVMYEFVFFLCVFAKGLGSDIVFVFKNSCIAFFKVVCAR